MTGKPHIVLVCCAPALTGVLRASFSDDYDFVECSTHEDGLVSARRTSPALVVLDMAGPDGPAGPAGLTAFKRLDRALPVVVVSSHSETSVVVQAMKLGASEFVSKPFDAIDLTVRVASVLKQRRADRPGGGSDNTGPRGRLLLGQSSRMAEIRRIIENVRDVDCTVLVRGESGTGKELVAREIAASTMREGRPFVKVNCAALPTELLESELFGFERGAFTGATQRKLGKFEFANQGTIFLDEIGELGGGMQAKLLQVLQDGEFSRLGGTQDTHVDVRIIAATNRDLEQEIAEGRFREDLFFRLNVISIVLPPLRERIDEIPVLAEHFVRKYSVQYDKPYMPISPETLRLFLEYHWPGNIRELENIIQRMIILGTEAQAREDIALGLAGNAAKPPAPRVATREVQVAPAQPRATAADRNTTPSLKSASRTAAREVERELILGILKEMRWNRKATAKRLGVSYKTLLAKIRDNGLEDDAPGRPGLRLARDGPSQSSGAAG
ncbi:MAG: sigma-54-dependent transcriptional regulator [Vicinamibacterales bacterium]